MSSTTANVVRNIFKEMGTLFPNIAKTPNEKAISVAIGMALPLRKSLPLPIYINNKTGITIPPIAATIGNNACFMEVNSPTNTSLFISSPIEKKKIAINASLINSITVIGCPLWLNKLKSPNCKDIGCAHQEKYISAIGELAMIKANNVATIKTLPPLA